MTSDVILFGAGALLVIAGVIGGGLEIKEIKLPQISRVMRACAMAVGFGLIGIGLWMKISLDIPKPTTKDTATQLSKQATSSAVEQPLVESQAATTSTAPTAPNPNASIDLTGHWTTNYETNVPNNFRANMAIQKQGNEYLCRIRAEDVTGYAEEECKISIKGKRILIFSTIVRTSNQEGWSPDDFELQIDNGKLVGRLVSNLDGRVVFERQ